MATVFLTGTKELKSAMMDQGFWFSERVYAAWDVLKRTLICENQDVPTLAAAILISEGTAYRTITDYTEEQAKRDFLDAEADLRQRSTVFASVAGVPQPYLLQLCRLVITGRNYYSFNYDLVRNFFDMMDPNAWYYFGNSEDAHREKEDGDNKMCFRLFDIVMTAADKAIQATTVTKDSFLSRELRMTIKDAIREGIAENIREPLRRKALLRDDVFTRLSEIAQYNCIIATVGPVTPIEFIIANADNSTIDCVGETMLRNVLRYDLNVSTDSIKSAAAGLRSIGL